MLFKSRSRPTVLQRLRLVVWPRVSWSRSVRYVLKRLFRVKASPHKIAIGCAAGVFASITPLIGVQMVMAGAIALILRGSIPAAMLATFLGNPVSWPLIWGVTYAVGSAMVGHPDAANAAALSPRGDALWPVIYTMLIGSIPIGIASAAVSYGIVARMVEAVQHGRSGVGPARLTLALWKRPPIWRLW
jgi:uncharacterized protein (DUF2062 family)